MLRFICKYIFFNKNVIKPDENKVDENKVDENKVDENKVDEKIVFEQPNFTPVIVNNDDLYKKDLILKIKTNEIKKYMICNNKNNKSFSNCINNIREFSSLNELMIKYLSSFTNTELIQIIFCYDDVIICLNDILIK